MQQIILWPFFFAVIYAAAFNLTRNIAKQDVSPSNIRFKEEVRKGFGEFRSALESLGLKFNLKYVGSYLRNKVLESRVESTNNDNDKLYVLDKKEDINKYESSTLLEDKENILHFKETNTSMYYDKKEETWFEVAFDENERLEVHSYEDLIPVSPCVESILGNQSSISYSYNIDLSVEDALAGELQVQLRRLPFMITPNIEYSVTPAVTFSGVFSCTIPQGYYGQLLIRPSYVLLPSGWRKRVLYQPLKGFVATDNKYEEFKRFKLISKKKADHVCFVDTDPTKLQCDF